MCLAGVTSGIVQDGRNVLEKFTCLSKNERTNVKLNPQGDLIDITKSQSIVYKTWSLEMKTAEKATKKSVENCLEPIWKKKITYINRGKRYGTIEERFASKDEAKKHSTTSLISTELLLLPTYLGKRTSKVKIEVIIDVV